MLPSLRWLPRLPSLGRAWKPLDFTKCSAPRISSNQLVEEETYPHYVASRYYPIRIGEILRERYQIVGKLGFGTTSTVWLARDLGARRHVALKLFIHSDSMGQQVDDEINIYKRIENGPSNHRGRLSIRSMLDYFDVQGPSGTHRCLVHQPLFESVLTFLHRNPIRRLPKPIVTVVLQRLFLALDYLHKECQVVHTDLKADNIMFAIDDEGVFTDFEQAELEDPSPRKEVDGRTIYTSRDLRMPREMGPPMLCDFGSAVVSDTKHTDDVQPDVYRAPEVWDIFEGGHLFYGHDPEHKEYRSRAHLAQMISLLGPPPKSLLDQGELTSRFFSKDGSFAGGIPVPEPIALKSMEVSLEGDDQELFLRMMGKMLQWDPRKRSTAGELVDDGWINSQSCRH